MARRRLHGRGSKPIPSTVPQSRAQHTYSSVKATLPDLSQSERTTTGVARLGGNLTAGYPRIAGFNSPGRISTPY